MIRTITPCVVTLFLAFLACQSPQGAVGASCKRESHCRAGLRCILSQCSDGSERSPCEQSTDCRKDLACSNQRCKAPEENISTEGNTKSEQPDGLAETEPGSIQDAATNDTPSQEQQSPPSSCRAHKDCDDGSWCLLQPNRRTSACTSSLRECLSDKDCARQPGTFCRLIPQRKSGSLLACLYPRDTGAPLKDAGRLCLTHEECQSGVCLASNQECGAFCQSNKDCPDQSFYCGTYSFFPSGEFGGCYRKCKNSSDCPEGFTCRTNEQCTPDGPSSWGGPCSQSTNCKESNAICIGSWSGGYCTKECSSTNRCPNGTQCNLLSPGITMCLRTCQTNSECRKEYFCASSAGTPQKVCWPRGKRRLGDLCEQNTDCRSGLCRLFPTGTYCTETCSPGRTCRAGFVCHSQANQEELCEKICANATDCPDGYQCIQRKCVIPKGTSGRSIGEACTENSHCQSQRCVLPSQSTQGLVFAHGYCSQQCDAATPCPSNSYCAQINNQKLCLRTCNSDTQCNNRKSYFCSFQRVQVSPQNKPLECSPQSPCPQNSIPWFCHTSLEGRACSLGFCLPRGVRQEGQTCLQDTDCRSGACYIHPKNTPRTACETQDDCPNNSKRPHCETQAKQCVACLHAGHCPQGQQCLYNRCTTGGYCTSTCQQPNQQCPKGTQCQSLSNRQNQPLGSFCITQCQSDSQCLQDFVCRTKTCQLQHERD